jgi:ferredoxin-type protein NapG
MNERLNRRSFLTLNLEATVSFLGNIIIPQLEQERDFFRPPGACLELEFLTLCSRCGKCADACPESIIKMFGVQHGAKLANTPFINPNESPCTLCGICAELCPAGALSQTDLSLPQSIGIAEVVKGNCLAHMDVMCDYCVRSCPVEGAITIISGKQVVNEQMCTGCGICVSSCISESKGIYVHLPKLR